MSLIDSTLLGNFDECILRTFTLKNKSRNLTLKEHLHIKTTT